MFASYVFLAAAGITCGLAFICSWIGKYEMKKIISFLSVIFVILAVLFSISETVDEKQKLQKDLKECQSELEKANEQLNSDYTARVEYVNMLKDSV
jgi:amino acid permease